MTFAGQKTSCLLVLSKLNNVSTLNKLLFQWLSPYQFPLFRISNFILHSTIPKRTSASTCILEACVKEFPLWPDKISVQEDMPAAFQNMYPDTGGIIDAAEMEVDRPCNPDTQSLTWSEYKSRNTNKFLLAVTPNGVSVLWRKDIGQGVGSAFWIFGQN